ncbi:pyruvate dehydrogenase (acetyl-transferring), homodimeric type, partial [Streptomyces sp. SID12501]|nr:pyruvate dehydrogenase (acetyl-transferring), homodimeric type [Streptomyces sp. SID12501]
TVILAHTIKGYGLGSGFAGRNATHQMKKLKIDELKTLRDSLHIPITDEQLEADPYLPPYYNPGPKDEAIQYMLERRRQLGGFVPERRSTHTKLTLPGDKVYETLAKGPGTQEVATPMALVRLFKDLVKDKDFGHR